MEGSSAGATSDDHVAGGEVSGKKDKKGKKSQLSATEKAAKEKNKAELELLMMPEDGSTQVLPVSIAFLCLW